MSGIAYEVSKNHCQFTWWVRRLIIIKSLANVNDHASTHLQQHLCPGTFPCYDTRLKNYLLELSPFIAPNGYQEKCPQKVKVVSIMLAPPPTKCRWVYKNMVASTVMSNMPKAWKVFFTWLAFSRMLDTSVATQWVYSPHISARCPSKDCIQHWLSGIRWKNRENINPTSGSALWWMHEFSALTNRVKGSICPHFKVSLTHYACFLITLKHNFPKTSCHGQLLNALHPNCFCEHLPAQVSTTSVYSSMGGPEASTGGPVASMGGTVASIGGTVASMPVCWPQWSHMYIHLKVAIVSTDQFLGQAKECACASMCVLVWVSHLPAPERVNSS